MMRARRSSAYPLRRRVHHVWQKLIRHERYKSNTVSFLDFGRPRYKQVRFSSVAEARRVEDILRATQQSRLFPALVHRLESTLWVRYIPGSSIDAANPEHLEAVTRFFATLYAERPRQLSLAETDLPSRLRTHIETLAEVGWIDDDCGQRLLQMGETLAPDTIWVGLEYIDSLRKNLILAESGAVGIDVEAAWDDQLLGVGLAKARLRWLEQPSQPFLQRLLELGAPDLREQYPYAHLVFLAQYGVQSLFRGKSRRIPATALKGFLDQRGT